MDTTDAPAGTTPVPGRFRWLRMVFAVALVLAVGLCVGWLMLRNHIIAATQHGWTRENIMSEIRHNMTLVESEADRHTLYLPQSQAQSPRGYPWEGGGHQVDGALENSFQWRGANVEYSQFAAKNLTEKAVGAWSPADFCSVGKKDPGKRGPAGTCLAVPGYDAKFLWDTKAWEGPDDRRLVLVAVLPGGTVINVDAVGYKSQFRDPTQWAKGLLDSLVEFDPSRYTTDDLYKANHYIVPG